MGPQYEQQKQCTEKTCHVHTSIQFLTFLPTTLDSRPNGFGGFDSVNGLNDHLENDQ